MKNIALTGGGTAGHITPNLALIPELKKRQFNIIYIGSKNGMEKDIMKIQNIPFFGITADKLRRYIDFKNLSMPLNVLKGISEAKKILKSNKINIVFSKGGYVSVPVVIASAMLKIPVISHEADFTPGLANKIATPLSKKICCNFLETADMIGNKGVFTGCPIRSEILNGDRNKGLNFLNFNNNKPILFVSGGSLGSVYLNNLIRNNLSTLLKSVNIVHSCGKNKLNKNLNIAGYRQFEILYSELPHIFAASDYVIGRAGANFIFEVLALKKPNLLIPLSTKASRGDQILNANSFMKKKYSLVLLEDDQDKNPTLFIKKFNELTEKKDEMINAMNSSIEINAIEHICDIIESYTLLKNRK